MSSKEDIVPGVVVLYRDTRCEILRDREIRKDTFGLNLQSWWARVEEDGREGYISFGADLVNLPLEIVEKDN